MNQILNLIENESYFFKKNHDIYWNDKEFILEAVKIRDVFYNMHLKNFEMIKRLFLKL